LSFVLTSDTVHCLPLEHLSYQRAQACIHITGGNRSILDKMLHVYVPLATVLRRSCDIAKGDYVRFSNALNIRLTEYAVRNLYN